MEVSEKQTRRQYSDEYKSEAVRLVRESGKPLSQVARELGLNDNMLHRWSREEKPSRCSRPLRARAAGAAAGLPAALLSGAIVWRMTALSSIGLIQRDEL